MSYQRMNRIRADKYRQMKDGRLHPGHLYQLALHLPV